MRPIDADELKTHKFLTPQVKVIGGRRCGKTREQITEAYQQGWNDCIDAIIDNAPTVKYPFYAEAYQTGYEEGKNERTTGEWLDNDREDTYRRCSICNELVEKDNFCGNCGADMRKGEEK